MSIESNKLMNLADGKLLYDDLRRRIGESITYATDEEIQNIIDHYGRLDPLFVVMHYVNTENGTAIFKSEMIDNDIIDAYKSGRTVYVIIPDSELQNSFPGSGMHGELRALVISCIDKRDLQPQPSISFIGIAGLGDLGNYGFGKDGYLLCEIGN